MRITYNKKNKNCSSKGSCLDFEIQESWENEHRVVTLTAKEDITLRKAYESLPLKTNHHDYYFLNGYQSWTDTKEFKLAERLRNIKKSPHIIAKMFAMSAYGDVNFYRYSIKKSHGYDVFYSKGKHESFVYNNNFDTAYLIIEMIKDRRHTIRVISEVYGLKVKKGETIRLFDYYFFNSFLDGLKSFNVRFPPLNKEKIFGYSSWYNYYQNINEEIILRDLKALDSRFNLFQIDDGFETFVGDWLDVDKKKFPNGLAPILKEIHKRGFKAGLWLAPFVAEEKSKLFAEHKDWFIKDKHGHPVKSGGNWSGHYALDLTIEEVRNYIEKCLKHYMDMGFDFFKLDFLYAGGIQSYKGVTRCMAQKQAYKFLRLILKDKLVLGCGANIINSYGAFDYLRVGPDVSLIFDDVAYMRLFHRERISTKVTLQNTIHRSIFDQRLFANDPDVFLLRDNNIQLSPAQKEALIKINALFGSVLMTSDNIAEYDENKKKILGEALDIFLHASERSYEKHGCYIDIKYQLHNEEHGFTYNTKKGVLSNVR